MDPARRSWHHRANAGEQRLACTALPATPAFAPAWRVKFQDFFQILWFAQHNSYSLAFLRWQRAPRTSYSRPFLSRTHFVSTTEDEHQRSNKRKRGPSSLGKVFLQRFPVHPWPSCVEMFAIPLGEVGMI